MLGAPCGRWVGWLWSCTAWKGGTGDNYVVWSLVGEREPAPIRKVQRILFLLVKQRHPCHRTGFLGLRNKFTLERESQGGCCLHQTCRTLQGLCLAAFAAVELSGPGAPAGFQLVSLLALLVKRCVSVLLVRCVLALGLTAGGSPGDEDWLLIMREGLWPEKW